jgi:formate dehydrogenase maturation protein FdhE
MNAKEIAQILHQMNVSTLVKVEDGELLYAVYGKIPVDAPIADIQIELNLLHQKTAEIYNKHWPPKWMCPFCGSTQVRVVQKGADYREYYLQCEQCEEYSNMSADINYCQGIQDWKAKE